jgi:Tfp pilus assembly protein FimT
MKSRAASARARRRAWPGFTLLELFLVVAGAAILMVITTPIILRVYQNVLVDEAAQTLRQALRGARSNALSNRNDSPFGVRIFDVSSTLVVFQGASYATRNAAEDELITYSDTANITGTSTEVVFSRLYGTSTVDGIFTVTNGSRTISVRVNSYGTIQVE